MEKVIANLPKGSGEEVRVSLGEFKGKQYIDLRVYFENDDGEWKPTKKGVALSVNLFHKLKDALKEAEDTLKENGLLPDEEDYRLFLPSPTTGCPSPTVLSPRE